jgi:hypothetical protein
MKVTVRYWTEFGGSESTMKVEEIASFSERFKIMSVTPNKKKKKKYNEVFDWLAKKDYLSDKVKTIQKEFEEFKNK